jgi:hypothetical protein
MSADEQRTLPVVAKVRKLEGIDETRKDDKSDTSDRNAREIP